MSKIANWAAAIALIFPEAPRAAQAEAMGWPEAIAKLTQERTQAEICVGMIKSGADAAAIGRAKTTYGAAKAEMDGVIAGLITVLVEGGKPESLPTVRAGLETSGKNLQQICDAAAKTAPPNAKGVWDEVAKAAIEPVVRAISDGVGALWTRHVEKDKLEIETKKAQLEAAEWPDFGDIAAR